MTALPRVRIGATALRSAAGFLRLAARGGLRLRPESEGRVREIAGRGKYVVFRDTVSRPAPSGQPMTLEVGFRLKLIGKSRFLHWLFERVSILTTPFWSGLPGFHVKLWMVDRRSGEYAGLYDWRGREQALQYLGALIPVLRFLSVRGSVWYHARPRLSAAPAADSVA